MRKQTDFVRAQIILWLGHVFKMRESRMSRKMLDAQSLEGKGDDE